MFQKPKLDQYKTKESSDVGLGERVQDLSSCDFSPIMIRTDISNRVSLPCYHFRHSPMDNRRNYYRILEVQPDAPPEVIRQNYKLLMQKLRMHPDFGGNQRDAALINVAYDTLRNPQKRAIYDRKLLQENNIVQLSQGHLKRPTLFSRKQKLYSEPFRNENRRNYYRLLQVQPDAHAAVIRERYLYLLQNNDIPQEMLHEAYVVLNNAQQRIAYDRLLKKHGHNKAVQKLQARADHLKKSSDEEILFLAGSASVPDDHIDYAGTMPAVQDFSAPSETGGAFDSLITRYCAFCKTPHAYNHRPESGPLCPTCSSPLFSFADDQQEKRTRSLDRIKKTGTIFFYVYWPGHKLRGSLFDLSPQGLRFTTAFGLDTGQIIKIDGEKFKAAAEVVHNKLLDDRLSSIGVRFRTVAFHSAKGNFLTTSV